MDARQRVQAAVNGALRQLLRPLCRLLLRYHVPFGTFEALAKHVYVQVAMEDFAIPGRRPTVSRASILTGLTRKEVQRLVGEPVPERAGADEAYNRAARVVTGWARDAAFHGPDGRPAPLPLQQGDAAFAALVRRYSGDMPVRAVLDELLRVGAVRERPDGRLELAARAYVPGRGEAEKLAILGRDVADLVATIDHNLQHGADDPRFQRKVMYRRVPASLQSEFRALAAARSQALLEELDRWLADRAGAAGPAPEGRLRLGVGVYYFEAPDAGPGRAEGP